MTSDEVHGPIVALGEGRFRLSLGDNERGGLLRFLEELRRLLNGDVTDDLRTRRLFPTAYHDDPEADAEYQRLMQDELMQSRLAAISSTEELLRAPVDDVFDESALLQMMKVINGLRLVLGTLLDVGEDDHPDIDDDTDDEPVSDQHFFFGYLGWLLDWIVAVLAEEPS